MTAVPAPSPPTPATPTVHTAVVTLPTDTTILIVREFAAPPEAVWQAWTDPGLVARWWAGQRGAVVSIENELRVGSRWRYVMTAYGGCGRGVPDAEAVDTAVFEPWPEGRTRVGVTVGHRCREHRDAHVGWGTEGGMQEAWDLLDQVAVTLR